MSSSRYYAIKRFKELYAPTTYTFQFWLAFLSFTLFIFTLLFRYSPLHGGWYVLDALITTLPKLWLYVFVGMGTILVIVSLFAFVSFLIVCFHGIFGVGIKDARSVTPKVVKDE